MKVLKNNYQPTNVEPEAKRVEPYPRKTICNECGSELEYEKSDIKIGVYGAVMVNCPCCGHDTMIDSHEDELTLTMNNIEFPVHFYHTSKENGAVDVCNNDEIRKRIQDAIKYFRKNKDAFVWQSESGNLFLVVYRYDGDHDYTVILTDNFYSTYIPFENEDYSIVKFD